MLPADQAFLFFLCLQRPTGSPLNPTVVNISIWYLRQLLAVHPPGQHRLVDQQYYKFVKSLGAKDGTFGLWEYIENLLR